MSEGGEDELARLFAEFLAAEERGRDAESEMLARAGAARDALASKIKLHREVKALGELAAAGAPHGKQRLGRFEILDVLGEGGISRVLLAFDPKLGRRIALKIIERGAMLDKDQRA